MSTTREAKPPTIEDLLDTLRGAAALSPWARFVALDADGQVYEYENQPWFYRTFGCWIDTEGGRWERVRFYSAVPADVAGRLCYPVPNGEGGEAISPPRRDHVGES